MNRAVFAGTFDPFTLGHYDIVSRASRLFDEIIVGVSTVSSGKRDKLDVKKRLEIVKASLFSLKNITVKSFDGFLVDFVKGQGATVLIRGLRTANDFEYEKALCEVYKQQYSELECLYLISTHNYNHISGSVVRDLAALGGDISNYVCKDALEIVKKFYKVK